MQITEQVEASADGRTVWVHALDGSTVGRFSTLFGMDAHTSITEQLAGARNAFTAPMASQRMRTGCSFARSCKSTMESRLTRL